MATFYNNSNGVGTTRGYRADVPGPKQVRAIIGPMDIFITCRFTADFNGPSVSSLLSSGVEKIEFEAGPASITVTLSEKYSKMIYAQCYLGDTGPLVVTHTDDTNTVVLEAAGPTTTTTVDLLLLMRRK